HLPGGGPGGCPRLELRPQRGEKRGRRLRQGQQGAGPGDGAAALRPGAPSAPPRRRRRPRPRPHGIAPRQLGSASPNGRVGESLIEIAKTRKCESAKKTRSQSNVSAILGIVAVGRSAIATR